ncbi:MAG: cupin domain-containing protein [Roseibium sp.]|uniref:cupin domain-containing protein n=1 Tax=Roseibium sp. TaxID=1936156 RepID=UPI002631BFAC|nr:cupin domain-containing protein [Roseibium sp.]MCV0428955.1 cupin domain-containing protein [Roseibium sp.]
MRMNEILEDTHEAIVAADLDKMQRGFAEHVDHQAVEGGTDPVFGTVEWKTLICANKTPSSGLVFGVANFPPNGCLNPHRHAPAEFYFGLAGSGTVTINGETLRIEPGVAIYVPPNAEHGVNADAAGLSMAYGFPSDTFGAIAYEFA